MPRAIAVSLYTAGALALVLVLASLVLAWLSVRSGGVQEGWELVPFLIYPLIATVIASIAFSFLLILGLTVEGALRLSRGRVLRRLVLVPLAVAPVVGLALWPWTLAPPRAATLCRDEAGFRGAPLPVAGFLDGMSGRRDGWKQEIAKRLLHDGYLFVEEPAHVARERVQALRARDALRDFEAGEGRIVRYLVASRNHAGCDRLPGLRVHPQDRIAWAELGLPSGACLAFERSDAAVARYELRAARDHQLWPTYVRWDELRIVDLESGEVTSRFRAFGPPSTWAKASRTSVPGTRCA